jgi:hypothetical protein
MLAIVVLTLPGCDGTPQDSGASIAGQYSATTFIASQGETEVDLLAAGGSLDLTLGPSGTVSGELNIPETEFGDGFVANMAGTYTLTGTTVTFNQPADTFVRDLPWTVEGVTLHTTGNAGGGAVVAVVLTRL